MRRTRGAGARASVTLGLALAASVLVASGCANGPFGFGVPRGALRFAVWTSIAEPGGAVPFLGYWDRGGFVDLSARGDALPRALSQYRPGAVFSGTSEDGAAVRLVFERGETSRAAGEIAELLSFRVEQGGGDPALRSVLVHSADARVEALAPESVDLAPELDAILRRRAEALFRRALPSRAAPERFDAMELGAPEARRVAEAPEVLALLYPATLVQHGDRGDALRDERASVFFLWDTARREATLAAFGHPDWSPQASAKDVVSVQPLGWFRVEGDERIYLFATRQLGAEPLGWAILELRTGQVALHTP